MKLLVLHRIPFDHVRYGTAIEHDRHEVHYFGIEPVLGDIPPSLPCKKLRREREDVISSAEVGRLKREAYDQVIAMSEFDLLEAAELRKSLGVQGMTTEQVLAVRDKVVMKDRAAQAGIRVPRYARVSDALEKGPDQRWSGETILKPVDGAASKGVVRFTTFAAAMDYVGKELSAGRMEADKAQLDEYIEGQIMHIDGVVWNASVLTFIPSFYQRTPLDYANGLPVGSVQVDPTPDYLDFTERSLEALGIDKGCFHLECILTPQGELVFLEMGARMGGANIPQVYEMATGVYLPEIDLALRTGNPLARKVLDNARANARRGYFGLFLWPGHIYGVGKRCKVQGAERFRASKHIAEWRELKPDQAMLQDLTYYTAKLPLAGILKGQRPAELMAFINEMFATIKITTTTATQEA